MARQALSEKSVRRYARMTGLPIERILARGGSGHWMLFRTSDHRHGRIKAGTGEVKWDAEPMHWSSCDERFPGFRDQPLTRLQAALILEAKAGQP